MLFNDASTVPHHVTPYKKQFELKYLTNNYIFTTPSWKNDTVVKCKHKKYTNDSHIFYVRQMLLKTIKMEKWPMEKPRPPQSRQPTRSQQNRAFKMIDR